MRFGLLALASGLIVFLVAILSPSTISSDFSLWYVSHGLVDLGVLVAITLWCFYHALGGRKVWKGDLMEG